MENQKAIIILGMHRSGTSAVTRLCNLLGAEISENLMKEAEDNNRGFFEHKDVVAIHDELLDNLGSSWDDILPLPENWWQDERAKSASLKIKEVIKRDFSRNSLWAVKDPRMCKLIPLWLDILKELNIEPLFLLVNRSAMQVARSLEKRDGFVIDKSLLLWTEHFLESEKWSRKHKRSFIDFDSVMKDWQKEMSRTAQDLAIEWPAKFDEVKPEVESFIEPSLVHHREKEEIKCSNELISGWAKRVTEIIFTIKKTSAESLDLISGEIRNTLAHVAPFSSFLVKELNVSRNRIKEIEEFPSEEIRTRLHQANLAYQEASENLIKTSEAFAETKRQLEETRNDLEGRISAIINSTSWRITAPIRLFMDMFYKSRFPILRYPSIILKLALHGKFREIVYTIKRQFGFISEIDESSYQSWIKQYDPRPEDINLMSLESAEWKFRPLISVVMPVYNSELVWLEKAINSVINQAYSNWELCIADDCSTDERIWPFLEKYAVSDKRIKIIRRKENGHISECSNSALELATGEFIALLDHDDELSPDALYRVAKEITKHPDVDLIYSDEDKIDKSGQRFAPYFKPDWNIDLCLAQNFFSHLGVYRTSLLQDIKGFRKDYEGSQDHDLLLRAFIKTNSKNIIHIPRILYHWRTTDNSTSVHLDNKDYALSAGRRAVQDFLDSYSKGANVVSGNIKNFHRIIWPLPEKLPKVSLIIPTRNRVELLKKIVESIREKTKYPYWEMIIVDNQSDDYGTIKYMEDVSASDSRIKILKYNKPFNFSAICNAAVEICKGEVIGLINNDTEVITSPHSDRCWLSEMVSHAVRENVGAVGAKLLFPNNTIQHAGVVLGGGLEKGCIATHFYLNQPKSAAGYFGGAKITHAVSAVTGACLLLRKELYIKVGGMDENNLAVAFNDVDLCLKLQEIGLSNIYCAEVELYHYESASRGKMLDDRFRKEEAYMQKRWMDILRNDPFYNPNLHLPEANFALAFPPRVTELK